ncbi:hypothetical protein AOC36_04965 [Erysipelothrix larvae]|uniref:Uncharacterized protein n=1 Tax=Erysipelothrix larvae TaxID=1514105 RepID=A0A0X8GZQ6_9FIRM|nr:hypothetical protein [Erysipelothrix larvae]AMC93349.1 hypothetical protein AOC36_04965 [Erysipelothrix larvae]
MKSRVQKNHELYETLASSTEEKVESSDLSRYANQLNDIDSRFERMNIMGNVSHDPSHARDDVTDNESLTNVYDTFENEYLKDFLEEVKEYNVKKGYRTSDDTQTNILGTFTTNSVIKKDIHIEDDDVDSIESLVSSIEKNQDAVNEINQTKEYGQGLVHPEDFGFVFQENYDDLNDDLVQDIETLFDDVEPNETLDSHDSELMNSKELLLKQGLDPEENWRTSDIPIFEGFTEEIKTIDSEETKEQPLSNDALQQSIVDEQPEPIQKSQPIIDDIEHEPSIIQSSIDTGFEQNVDVFELNRVALEETKTIQLKLEEQQKDIQSISKSMVQTNRILNTVIAIVLLCFFLVVAFIVKMFWFS